MKRIFALLTAVLCLTMLTGCPGPKGLSDFVHYDDMVYTRPDMDALEAILDESCEIARESEDLEEILDAIWAFYDVYDSFYTNSNLAYIRYCCDMTDSYWQEEQEFCNLNSATVDAGLEELYMALADSPLRSELEEEYFGEGYFDAYEEDSMWDDGFVALLEEESELLMDYYELYSQSLTVDAYSPEFYEDYAPGLGQIFVELIALRQDIAAYAGYDSYPEFAYDCYYYRDYTWEEADGLLLEIQQELAPLYQRVFDSDVWELGGESCTESETFDYVRACTQAMDGTVLEAFELMDRAGLYDIGYGANKNDTGFELYLTSYYEPFIFLCPSGTAYDKLTFAHEFGHFANDYASYGSYVDIDVHEFFSQGMEYLSLCYGTDTGDLTRLKLADSLAVYVEQAAYARFEHEAYQLRGEELTVENLFALFARVGQEFGFEDWYWDGRDLTLVPHFYEQPMYIISYVISNDAAMQLYQLETAEPGAGLEKYQSALGTEENYFLAFLDTQGLESPFATGRMAEVRQTFEELLETE